MAVVFIGWGTQQFQAGTTVTGGLTNALQAGHATYPNPVGFLPRHGWYSDLLTVIFVLAVLTAIAVVASVFARRRVYTRRHQQVSRADQARRRLHAHAAVRRRTSAWLRRRGGIGIHAENVPGR
jgi:hypothetical protein